ncbi:MAG: NAD(P)/FAD-dependent oxidoreductase [Alphaproteobacteria bacterium]
MDTQVKDIAIIGAGPAGLFAAFQAGLLGLSTVILDSLPQAGGQMAALYPEKEILDVPGFISITGAELSERLVEQAAPFNKEWYFNTAVEALEKKDGIWHLSTSGDHEIYAKTIIIAAGGGSFKPKRPPQIEDIEAYEGTSIHYSVFNPGQYKDKSVVIIGGGDSAVDWAMHLTELGAKVTLVHRRDKFRALAHHVEKIKEYAEQGILNLQTGMQLHNIEGAAPNLSIVNITDFDGNITPIEAEHMFIFMGLNKDLGPIAQWGLSESKTRIDVNPATFETSEPSIFAIGDIAYWSGKVPLIVTGFGEAATATRSAFLVAKPEEKLSKMHSTSMKIPD